MKTVLTVIAVLLATDFVGFVFWVLSGQHPADNFYVGTITAHILALFV